MADQIMVQVRFKEMVTVLGKPMEFNDAVYYSQAEYPGITQAQIDTLKQQRIIAWKNSIENPAPRPEPTKAELQAEKVRVQNYITELDSKIAGAK